MVQCNARPRTTNENVTCDSIDSDEDAHQIHDSRYTNEMSILNMNRCTLSSNNNANCTSCWAHRLGTRLGFGDLKSHHRYPYWSTRPIIKPSWTEMNHGQGYFSFPSRRKGFPDLRSTFDTIAGCLSSPRDGTTFDIISIANRIGCNPLLKLGDRRSSCNCCVIGEWHKFFYIHSIIVLPLCTSPSSFYEWVKDPYTDRQILAL